MKVSLTRLIVLGLIIFSFLFASCSSRLLDNCAIFDVFFALGCKPYEMEVKTTVDGLEYCITRDNTIFICDVPDASNVVIPEYIEGIKVVKLCCKEKSYIYSRYDYIINNSSVKNLTIQHEFAVELYDAPSNQIHYYANFTNLDTLTFIDFLYCNLSSISEELIVPHYIGNKNGNVPNVILKKSDREYSLEEFQPKVILIPNYVTEIEKGVFDGLEDVVIKTSYESIPEGWEEGWNGDCEVIWGEEIEYLSFEDCIDVNEDDFKYYYNSLVDEGIYIYDRVNGYMFYDSEVTIPEYINGKKVVELGNRYLEGWEAENSSLHIGYIEELTIQHEFNIYTNNSLNNRENYVCFPSVKNLIFIDFLYCNLTKETNELIVSAYIGYDPKNTSNFEGYPSVILKKSDRKYSLENFKPKVIIIPEYVTIIEKGVFDGLEDVVIKTSYESIPEGWEEGWNGDCEVIWGVDLELE
ncbi:MAG: hypothetical protein IKT40_04105 [Bacilli bacterium]|nr:hypothetical protein [Bacilli bacterium]